MACFLSAGVCNLNLIFFVLLWFHFGFCTFSLQVRTIQENGRPLFVLPVMGPGVQNCDNHIAIEESMCCRLATPWSASRWRLAAGTGSSSRRRTRILCQHQNCARGSRQSHRHLHVVRPLNRDELLARRHCADVDLFSYQMGLMCEVDFRSVTAMSYVNFFVDRSGGKVNLLCSRRRWVALAHV